jgi:hypothetical protein
MSAPITYYMPRPKKQSAPQNLAGLTFSGAPGGTRTPGTRFRKPLLYPPELRAHNNPAAVCGALFINGAPGEIRTPDLLIRSQTLYPAELQAHL